MRYLDLVWILSFFCLNGFAQNLPGEKFTYDWLQQTQELAEELVNGKDSYWQAILDFEEATANSYTGDDRTDFKFSMRMSEVYQYNAFIDYNVALLQSSSQKDKRKVKVIPFTELKSKFQAMVPVRFAYGAQLYAVLANDKPVTILIVSESGQLLSMFSDMVSLLNEEYVPVYLYELPTSYHLQNTQN